MTHPILLNHLNISLREEFAFLVVIDTLYPVAFRELVPDDLGFHGAHPGFTKMLFTLV